MALASCDTTCVNGAGQGAGEAGGCNTVCSSSCYENCWGECDGGCDTSSSNSDLNENGQCAPETTKGDAGSNDENNKEVNTCESNGSEAEGGNYGCQGRANNTCGSTASSNYCSNDCINDCATCADQCGDTCEGTAKGECGCGSNCSGGCSGGCSGCSGSCSGGCQGSCKGQCNKGCTNQEQEENAKVTLDRIVNVNNVKDIYKFIVYEARRRAKYYGYRDWENKLSGHVASLNNLIADYPENYNDIVFSTFYLDENGENQSCEYIEKEITEPVEIEAWKDLYVDDNGKVQYGYKNAEGIISGDINNPTIFKLKSFHTGVDLENYYFNLDNNSNIVYRYKKSPKNKMYIQEYRYTVKEHKKYESNMIFLLYYTIPRIFEDTLDLMNKDPGIQSETLVYDWNLKEYISTALSPEDKHYADIISAKKWISLGHELYNEILPIYDAR